MTFLAIKMNNIIEMMYKINSILKKNLNADVKKFSSQNKNNAK